MCVYIIVHNSMHIRIRFIFFVDKNILSLLSIVYESGARGEESIEHAICTVLTVGKVT